MLSVFIVVLLQWVHWTVEAIWPWNICENWFTDIIDQGDQQFMGIGWVPFPVANEMWDLLDKGGRRISCTLLLEFPDTSHEFVLCYCRLVG